jgi:hypothetical protein
VERRKHEIIFEARIDYSDSRNMRLDAEGYPEIEQSVRRALTEDLPHEMDTIFGVNIDVQVKGTREGSITVFFGVVAVGIVLIQNQACRVIQGCA